MLLVIILLNRYLHNNSEVIYSLMSCISVGIILGLGMYVLRGCISVGIILGLGMHVLRGCAILAVSEGVCCLGLAGLALIALGEVALGALLDPRTESLYWLRLG